MMATPDAWETSCLLFFYAAQQHSEAFLLGIQPHLDCSPRSHQVQRKQDVDAFCITGEYSPVNQGLVKSVVFLSASPVTYSPFAHSQTPLLLHPDGGSH